MSGFVGFPKPGRGGAGSGVTASPFMQTVLDDADASAARDTLGIVGAETDRLVSGGGVAWESGYTFRVAAATYYIAGTLYRSEEQTVTLAASDATNARIDVLALNNQGQLVALTGLPSATASEPDIDPTSQLRLTFVLVEAGSVAPGTIANEVLYSENAEWTTGTTGSGWNPASSAAPYQGSLAIEATDLATGATLSLTRGSQVTLADDGVLVAFVRSKATWGKNRALRLQWQRAGANVGSPVTLGDGLWGFLGDVVGSYQMLAIPLSQFGLPASAPVDRLVISCARGPLGFHLDRIVVQAAGGALSPPDPGYLTREEADERYALPATHAPQQWTPNFTGAADVYIPANVAMTIAQGNAKIGTGTLAFAKSTAAAPGTFSATTLPATLEAGAWLKVTASAVTGFVATHLVRTA